MSDGGKILTWIGIGIFGLWMLGAVMDGLNGRKLGTTFTSAIFRGPDD